MNWRSVKTGWIGSVNPSSNPSILTRLYLMLKTTIMSKLNTKKETVAGPYNNSFASQSPWEPEYQAFD